LTEAGARKNSIPIKKCESENNENRACKARVENLNRTPPTLPSTAQRSWKILFFSLWAHPAFRDTYFTQAASSFAKGE